MLPGLKEIGPLQAYFSFLKNVGSDEMAVNGSVTPVRFDAIFPQTNRHFRIINAVLTISGGKIDDPTFFAGLAVALTNGLELGFLVTTAGGTVESAVGIPLKTNFDMVSYAAETRPWGFTKAATDVFVAEFFKDYRITFDPKYITGFDIKVSDDLTGLDSRRCGFRGIRT